MSILDGPIASGSIVADIVRRIENAIMAGELAPGDRLSEQAIAKQLGVSRGALREALRQLEGRKLVERTANVGARIATLSENELVDIFQIWEAIGSLAARLAARRITPKDLRELRELLGDYETEAGDRQRNFDIHSKFHRKIADASGNSRLRHMCHELFDILRIYRVRLMSAPNFFERARRVIDEQRAIIAAMETRDAEGAERTMRAHLANSLAYHIEISRPAGDSKAPARRAAGV